MRIDKYLKVSRLIKRRTVASEACSSGRVMINGKVCKPSSLVKVGDVIELMLGQRIIKIEVANLSEHVKKDEAASLYKVIEG